MRGLLCPGISFHYVHDEELAFHLKEGLITKFFKVILYG